MDVVGRAKRVRIYVNEGDRIGHLAAERALVEFLRRENAQEATVIRGIEGFGGTGEIHVSHLADLVQKLPLVVEWIDRLTPSLRPSALRSLMHRLPFAHPTQGERVAESHARAGRAADLMTTDVATAREDALLSSAIATMLKGSHKVLAVVDDGGKVVGIVDRADLLHGLVPRDSPH